jgi:hypothetical protein
MAANEIARFVLPVNDKDWSNVHKIPPIKIFSGAEEQVMSLPHLPNGA